MTGLIVKPADGEANLYGKDVSEMQENISVGDSEITGTCKKIEGYNGFNEGNPEEQSGHYLALAFDFNDGATVKTKVNGGKNAGPVDCTADKFCVYRLTDSQTQSITVTAEKDGHTKSKTYSLKGLAFQD